MDEAALRRARDRITAAGQGRPHPADVGAALDRSREQLEALAATAAELESAIPIQVGNAVRDGLREEVIPVARHIAEIRGLFNQSIRRLERIESQLVAERQARVDDLALLVDLVASGWRGVDGRLGRLDEAHAETTASLDALVESLVTQDDLAPEEAPSEPPELPAEPEPELAPGPALDSGYPTQGRQAEAIIERAGAEQASSEQPPSDLTVPGRAAAAA